MRVVLIALLCSGLAVATVQAEKATSSNSVSLSTQVRIVVQIPVRTELKLSADRFNAEVNTRQGVVMTETLEQDSPNKRKVYTATSL